ncbi:hypothetical protein J4216_02730 [Candidatus Woesearchaeota archaeon]|nr:hypothetical protein [Candidatus Woesearchaeota archaeon]
MAGENKTTIDHEEIKKWIEKRKGKPAKFREIGKDIDLLTINFPDVPEAAIEDISWEEFFNNFEENNLAFLYQEETKEGGISKFFKFIKREVIELGSESLGEVEA